FAFAGHGDDVAAELLRVRLRHVDHPFTVRVDPSRVRCQPEPGQSRSYSDIDEGGTMDNATNRKRTEQDFNRPFVTGEHFRHGLPIRRRAQEALADLKPAQMLLLLDALDEAATPVVEHLEPFAWVVPELEEFRASRTIGTTLAWWCKFHGQSAESLLVNTERYFCFGPEGSAIGAI
ncbi:hypothetical protein, partial [Rhodococcus opacus]|uniref:hypothetical protein n=1 Tax=Rhodococcus opacus TaxID=37919 RepID=UPI0029546AA2